MSASQFCGYGASLRHRASRGGASAHGCEKPRKCDRTRGLAAGRRGQTLISQSSETNEATGKPSAAAACGAVSFAGMSLFQLEVSSL